MRPNVHRWTHHAYWCVSTWGKAGLVFWASQRAAGAVGCHHDAAHAVPQSLGLTEGLSTSPAHSGEEKQSGMLKPGCFRSLSSLCLPKRGEHSGTCLNSVCGGLPSSSVAEK